MNLNKGHWNSLDGKEFEIYLKSFSKGKEKSNMEKRIANTSLDCIAVPSPVIKQIVKEISLGNFLEFLDLNLWANLSTTFVNAGLICKIKDFNVFEKYLKAYSKKCDNWASTDTLKFKLTEKNKEQFWDLSKSFVKSNNPFERRIGLLILLKMLKFDEYTKPILNVCNSFFDEQHYYVNMMNAWLICESFVKHRDETLNFLTTNPKLNKFTLNKAISKCQDSFRITEQDKQFLKTLRQK